MKYSLKHVKNTYQLLSEQDVLATITNNKGGLAIKDNEDHTLLTMDNTSCITMNGKRELLSISEEAYRYASLNPKIKELSYLNYHLSIHKDIYKGEIDGKELLISFKKTMETDLPFEEVLVLLALALWAKEKENIDIV